MYNIFKSVILSKNFELTTMLHKIDTIWVQGKITDTEKDELIKLAQDNADPRMSFDVAKVLEDHEARLRALEKGGAASKPAEEYPPYVPGRVYKNGDKCSENGKNYICTLPEHTDVCVWAPSGYPAYWREVV